MLKSPFLRARYILELKGIELNDSTNTIMDPQFLMQQMELREALDAAKQSNTPLDAVEEVLDQIEQLHDEVNRSIQLMFSEANPDYMKIADKVRKLQFFLRLREEANNLAAQFDHD